MFKKSRTQEDNLDSVSFEPSTSNRVSQSDSASVIGPTLVFKGELHAEEDLVIEGRIEGSIQHHEKNLTIGQQGLIKADINAKVITVQGTVEGDLVGDVAVILRGTAKVQGNIHAPRVVIEDGAQFNGRVDMGAVETSVSMSQETEEEDFSSLSYEAV